MQPVDATGIVEEQRALRQKYEKPKRLFEPDEMATLKRMIRAMVENYLTKKRKQIERGLLRADAPRQATEWRQRQLAALASPGTPSIDAILDAVSEVSGMPISDILGPNRSYKYTRPRFMAIALLRQLRADLSQPTIGRLMGNRDHTSILHALRQFEKLKGEAPFKDWLATPRIQELMVKP